MNVFALLLILLVFGVALYIVNRLVVMDNVIRVIVNLILVVALLVWLFRELFGGSITV